MNTIIIDKDCDDTLLKLFTQPEREEDQRLIDEHFNIVRVVK